MDKITAIAPCITVKYSTTNYRTTVINQYSIVHTDTAQARSVIMLVENKWQISLTAPYVTNRHC